MTVAPTPVHHRHWRYWSPWLLALLAFLLGALAIVLLYRLDVVGNSSGSATEGSGVPATQVRHLPRFSSVDLAGSNNVSVHVGAPQSVVVRGDDNLVDRVTTKVRAGALVVGNTSGSFSTRSPMSVEITVPTLDAVTLSGSGNVVVDGVQQEALDASLLGSGTLTGSGRATRLAVTVGGSGTARFTQLVASDVRAIVSGSGSIFVTATGTLDATVSGTGAILYSGNPTQVTKSVSGTGAVTAG